MNPETRAARDSLSAQLERADRFPQFDALIVGKADLRTVLAALDQQPDQIIVTDAVLTEAQAEELRRRLLAAQHDGTPIRVLDGHDESARGIQ